MAHSVTLQRCFLVIALVCISFFCCNSGKADAQTGIGGTGGIGSTGGISGTGGIGGTGGISGTGGVGGTGDVGDGDPAQIVAKALLCFNDKYIYSSCQESCRLTQSGNINVPPDYVDEYCNGPCLTETHLVLSCIESVLSNFIFYNRATIQDIKDTIQAGCGYGPERGNFNVAEHIQAEESSAYKTASKILSGLGGVVIAGGILLG